MRPLQTRSAQSSGRQTSHSSGRQTLALVSTLAAFIVLADTLGRTAAIIPARRAARLDVLDALLRVADGRVGCMTVAIGG
jgi:hypothetical protein